MLYVLLFWKEIKDWLKLSINLTNNLKYKTTKHWIIRIKKEMIKNNQKRWRKGKEKDDNKIE